MSPNEKMSIPEEFFSYQKYLWMLLNEAEQHNLDLQLIGYELCERTKMQYPLYRLVIHPENQQTICIVSGIHGNEIAGPLTIIHMLDENIEELPENYRYVIYPMVNPTGFDLRQRFDSDGRDLNAVYSLTLKSKNYQEVQSFYEDVIKFSPFEAVITLHEDSDRDKFYMYGLGKENLDFYHAICGFARTWIQPWTNAEIEGCFTDEYGLVLSTARDHAFDGALFSQGLTQVAYTFETPGKLDINFRVNLMNQLVGLSLHMLNSKHRMVSF